jgi:hypothetical protein
MTGLYFWQKWHRPFRYLYLLLLAVFVLCLTYTTYHYFQGKAITYGWEQVAELDNVRVTTDTFTKNYFDYSTEAESYLISERYAASDLNIPAYQTYTHLLLLATALAVLLTAVTYFSYYWYFASMGLFMYFLTTLNTELLEVSGLGENVVLIVLILLFAGLSYFYFSFRQQTSILVRFLSFIAAVLVSGAVILSGASVSEPAMYLSRYGIIVPLGLSLLFLLLVATDIIKGFLWLATYSKTSPQNRSVANFIVISIIYLLNLLFVFLKSRRFIDWDIFYIGAFPLLIISAVLGIWGFPKRRIAIKNIIDNEQAVSFLYLGLGITCFTTISLIYGTANDALITVTEDLILLSHLCFGFAFFVYVLFNFSDLMAKGLAVHKVMYQPVRLPYYAMTILGLIIAAIIILQEGFLIYYDIKGGYYSMVGDIYRKEDNILLADRYYKRSIDEAFNNHRASYALATMARNQDDRPLSQYYFRQAVSQRPTPQAYVGLSNHFTERDKFFDAIFVLKDGIKVFPDSPELNTNLGLVFSKALVLDSAFYFLNMADQHSNNKGITKANLLAFMLKHNLLDSLPEDSKDLNHLSYINNKLVAQNKFGKAADTELNTAWLPDSSLTNETFAYIYNFGLNQMKRPDSLYVQKLDHYRSIASNSLYAEDLDFVRAHHYLYKGETARAVEMLAEAARNSTVLSGLYFKQLGLWLMQKEAWQEAAKYFDQALNEGHDEALFNMALAYTEAGDIGNAISSWQQIQQIEDTSSKETANIMLTLIAASPENIINLSDDLKVQALHYNKQRYTPEQAESIYRTVTAPAFWPLAAAEMIHFHLLRNDLTAAQNIYSAMPDTKADKDIEQDINRYKALLLLRQNKFSELETLTKANEQAFGDAFFAEYIQARILENAGNKAGAENHYIASVSANPYYAEAIVQAARFIHEKQQQPEKAYKLLAASVRLNRDDTEILKAYALLSLQMRLTNFAEDGLNRLRDLLPKDEYSQFEDQYLKLEQQVKASNEVW